jgi:hypothetical protein
VYAGKAVPVDDIPPAELPFFRWYFLAQGVAGCLLGAFLSLACLAPLLLRVIE